MGLDINKITSNGAYKAVADKMSKASSTLGNKIENSSIKEGVYKFIKNIEPTGANNSFSILTLLMVGAVIVPRVLTALKRNPDDKEATKDELKEIMLRDIQTVLIVLFALKSINSLVAAGASKASGLPMKNRPYQKVFDKDIPFGEKLKAIGKNILDTLHPTEGVRALTNDEFVSKYSGYSSIDEIEKMFKEIESNGGNTKKVFNNVVNSLIKQQEEIINGNNKKGIPGLIQKANATVSCDGSNPSIINEQIENANKLLESLKELQDKDYTSLQDISNAAKNTIIQFFKNPDNDLVLKAKGMNAILRTGALAFEAGYLGFGLPALNERRLEKKYLENNKLQENKQTSKNQTKTTPFSGQKIKGQEAKIFKKFV